MMCLDHSDLKTIQIGALVLVETHVTTTGEIAIELGLPHFLEDVPHLDDLLARRLVILVGEEICQMGMIDNCLNCTSIALGRFQPFPIIGFVKLIRSQNAAVKFYEIGPKQIGKRNSLTETTDVLQPRQRRELWDPVKLLGLWNQLKHGVVIDHINACHSLDAESSTS